jgi:uncharacterized membrane protein YfcA
MNITILIITFLLLLEHTSIYYADKVNNFFTVVGLLIIIVISSFNVFGIVTWFIILSLSIGLFIFTFIEEWNRYKRG